MLLEKINSDIKSAMIVKDSFKLTVLRAVIAAFQNEAINLKKKEEGLNEQEEIVVLKREAKKRKDSISQFTAGGRPELAEAEKKELEILQTYLPQEMSQEKVSEVIEKVISEMGEVSPSQFGDIMKKVMVETKGQADGSLVSKIVKEKINS